MTDQDMQNMEVLLQRHTDKFRKEVVPKIDQLLEASEETCSHLQQQRVEVKHADIEAHHGVDLFLFNSKDLPPEGFA